MRRSVAVVTAAVAIAVVAGGLAATKPDETARHAAACPAGALRVTVRGTARCLSLAARQLVWTDVARARDRGSDGEPMLRQVASRRRLTVALVQRIVREGLTKSWKLPAPPALPAAARTAAAGGATGLSAATACSAWAPRQALVRLRWTPVAGAAEHRIAISRFPGGLESGNLEASGALGGDRGEIAWYRVYGQAQHRWRVLARVGETWVASGPAEFEGPLCATPMQP